MVRSFYTTLQRAFLVNYMAIGVIKITECFDDEWRSECVVQCSAVSIKLYRISLHFICLKIFCVNGQF